MQLFLRNYGTRTGQITGQGKASCERGEKQQHQNLLTGLIFDEYGQPYTPVFTNKKDRKYRYYCNPGISA